VIQLSIHKVTECVNSLFLLRCWKDGFISFFYLLQEDIQREGLFCIRDWKQLRPTPRLVKGRKEEDSPFEASGRGRNSFKRRIRLRVRYQLSGSILS